MNGVKRLIFPVGAKDVWRKETRPWFVWTALFPIALGAIAGWIARSVSTEHHAYLQTSFGNGELLLANAALLGASLDVVLRRKSGRDLSLFFGLIAMAMIIAAWTIRLKNGKPLTSTFIAWSGLTYFSLAVWAVVESIQQHLGARQQVLHTTVFSFRDDNNVPQLATLELKVGRADGR